MKSTATKLLRPYREIRTVKETAHLLLDLPIGVITCRTSWTR
jgi:hypothetical protein